MDAIIVVLNVRNAIRVPFLYGLLKALLVADDIPCRFAIKLKITLILSERLVKAIYLLLWCDVELTIFKSFFKRYGITELCLSNVLRLLILDQV